MNLVTAHDYARIRTSPLFRHMLENGYTLTLIQGRTPREVLRAMEAEPRGTGPGGRLLSWTVCWRMSMSGARC